MTLRIRDLPSSNQDERPADTPIDMLILHYTGMRNAQEAIDRLRDPAEGVSSHYVVDEDGAVLRLVPEAMRAWHAGTSYWRGHSELNARSIGIEIVNPGHEWGYRDFPVLQLAAVSGDPVAASDPGAQRARAQRCGTGPKGGSGGAIRLAEPGGERRRPVAYWST